MRLNDFQLEIIKILKKQSIKDRETSDTLNSLMPDSVPSVFITESITDIVNLIVQDNEYLDYIIEEYLCEDDVSKSTALLNKIKEELNEKSKNSTRCDL